MLMPVPQFVPIVQRSRKRKVSASLPPPVREFYASNEGRNPVDGREFVEYCVGIHPLKSVAAGPGAICEFLATWLAEEPQSPWLRTKIVILGYDCFGDDIFYAVSTPARKARGVYLAGMDIAGPEKNANQPSRVLCVAPTIPEWLENLQANDWIEYAALPGEMDDLPIGKRKKLRAYYNELNPGLRW